MEEIQATNAKGWKAKFNYLKHFYCYMKALKLKEEGFSIQEQHYLRRNGPFEGTSFEYVRGERSNWLWCNWRTFWGRRRMCTNFFLSSVENRIEAYIRRHKVSKKHVTRAWNPPSHLSSTATVGLAAIYAIGGVDVRRLPRPPRPPLPHFVLSASSLVSFPLILALLVFLFWPAPFVYRSV